MILMQKSGKIVSKGKKQMKKNIFGIFLLVLAISFSAEDELQVCKTNAECSDGVYCNGAEICKPNDPLADTKGCITSFRPCAENEICKEDTESCTTICGGNEDMDGDGVWSVLCGGTDCDDNDPLRFPGNTEVCDADGRDEDCDPKTIGNKDSDGDGFVDESCRYGF
ncbi:MAG: hypothetical protein GY781_01210 [Gammaproteobacteria bacterium]|nr:hypothetical protein [Gammaproteobacteria bacterium]